MRGGGRGVGWGWSRWLHEVRGLRRGLHVSARRDRPSAERVVFPVTARSSVPSPHTSRVITTTPSTPSHAPHPHTRTPPYTHPGLRSIPKSFLFCSIHVLSDYYYTPPLAGLILPYHQFVIGEKEFVLSDANRF